MIDEKSLRLGNCVMYENTTHVVEELRGRNNTIVTRWIKGTDHYIHTADELYPIPLTEEILLKCGFEKVSTTLDLLIYEIGIMPTFMIEKLTPISDYFTLRYCDVITRKRGESYRICDVKYLHQLQNLIYCLSSKELEVKL